MVELPLLQALLSGKPYAGPALMADMDTGHEAALTAVVDHVAQGTKSPRVLEVGSWLGGMTRQLTGLLDAVSKSWSLTCVEDFNPPKEVATAYPRGEDPLVSFYEDANARGILSGLFRHNLRLTSQGNIESRQTPLLAALEGLAAASCDLIILHGPRALGQYAEVLAQCRRLLAPGGVLCGTGLLVQEDEAHERGRLHANMFRHASFRLYDEQTGRAFHPEITSALAEVYGRVPAADGFWAAGEVRLPPARAAETESARDVLFDIVPHRNGFVVLHSSIPPSRLGSERLGEREIPDLLEFAPTLEEAEAKAARLTEREQRRKGTVLEETSHYYVCKYGRSTYLAQCKINRLPREFRIFTDRVGDYEIAPTLLKADSLAELRRKVAMSEAAMDARNAQHPVVERFNGYYLYAPHERHCVAVRLDVENGRPFSDLIGAEDLAPHVLTAPDLDTLRKRIVEMNRSSGADRGVAAEPEEWL